MHDMEGNKIIPVDIPNGHWLIWGQSGQGKTYAICRKIEQSSKRFLVLDNSGSYTNSELLKNRFEKIRQVKEINPFRNEYCWAFYAENIDEAAHVLTDAIVKVAEIGSYFQKKILYKAIAKQLEELQEFSFPFLVDTLNEMINVQKKMEENRDVIDNLVRLVNRFDVFEDIVHLSFQWSTEILLENRLVQVLQLSDFPDQQRQFLSELFLQLVWKDAKRNKKFDYLILDEFQNFCVKPQSASNQMLREGRKYGLSLIMSSQIISGYSREELEVLMQAGHFLTFKPTAKDIKPSAGIIDFENQKEWQGIMKNLAVGEAVLTGCYEINESKHRSFKPILVKTNKRKDSMNINKAKNKENYDKKCQKNLSYTIG